MKLPQKKCPRCESVLERLYHRERRGITPIKQIYVPIGYICPICRENMVVLDVNFREEFSHTQK